MRLSASHRFAPVLAATAAITVFCGTASAQFVLESQQTILGIDDGEITPDGRYIFLRDNLSFSSTRIIDTSTGQILGSFQCTDQGFAVLDNGAQDAVVVTEDRAVVLGQCTPIFDLANPTVPMVVLDTGIRGRDLAVSPNEDWLAIRGGLTGPYNSGAGLFIVDLATGTVVANAPGDPSINTGTPFTFDVDSVEINDEYAAFVSLEGTTQSPTTRVTIFQLAPPAGGPPAIVFETTQAGADQDQSGPPHDIAMTPNGDYVVVRSEDSVGLYELNGAQTQRVWDQGLFGTPGPFGSAAMDSVEVTDDWIATISRDSTMGFAAQLDLFDIAGNQRFNDIPGDPHDLTFTPNGELLLVRTSAGLFMYDVRNVVGGPQIPFTDSQPLFSTHTSFGAGMDTIVALDDVAVTLSREFNSAAIDFWNLSPEAIDRRGGTLMDNRPLDLEISPNGRLVGIAGTRSLQVWDLESATLLLDTPNVAGSDFYPWCDGIAMNDDTVIAFGHNASQGGWFIVADLFSAQNVYCSTSPNSVGEGATIYASGSPSEAANNLELFASGLPANTSAQFVYGAGQINVPFGDGISCVGGQAFRFPVQRTNGAGVATRPVDNSGPLRFGGAIAAGTTWNFQLVYRDRGGPGGMGGAGFNSTDAIEIAFEN